MHKLLGQSFWRRYGKAAHLAAVPVANEESYRRGKHVEIMKYLSVNYRIWPRQSKFAERTPWKNARIGLQKTMLQDFISRNSCNHETETVNQTVEQ
jgi:hypothetical protein